MFSLVLLLTPDAHAQRYLSEFVGTTKVTATTGVAAIDTNLAFDTLNRRVLTGDFSFTEIDGSGVVETELFSVNATLAASGQCPARLSNSTTTGKLQLDEYTFDTNAFALYGSFELEADGGTVKLATGRLRGPTVLLNPPAESILFAADEGSLTLDGDVGSAAYTLLLDGVDDTGSARGEALDEKGNSAWSVVLSASTRWLYLVGSSDVSVVIGRAAVETDEKGNAVGGTGTWEELSEAGKVLDSGSFVVKL